MNIDYTSIYDSINVGVSVTGSLVKVLVGLILFAIVFYSFMFILKFRVLQDTVDISSSAVSKLVVTVNLVISLLGAILAFILILL
ncbi:MAG: hypothetical protein PHG60_02065 [Candidatus Dojkabacteria bacterium]|jgi:hypothetical protein|nr:hypothetical protein [Candidatus Dojkabacteria bacterium]